MTTLINAKKFPNYAKFMKTLQCPLCKSQLVDNCHPNGSQLYCPSNNNEYECGWIFGCDEYDYESIKHMFGQYEYRLYSRRVTENIYNTSIVRYHTISTTSPLYARTISYEKLLSIKAPPLLFFRNKMDEETFLNKLKLYLVFS